MSKTNFMPMIILGLFYFIFGFVTWLNGTLVQYLKIACELNNFQAMLVTFAFFISYTVMALPCSGILKRTGFKNGMMLGLLIMAAGAFLFIPAAYSRAYIVFLFGLFLIGTGLTILQTAVNPYVTIMGPIESAAKRISIMGICNKAAGLLAPLLLAAIVLGDSDTIEKKIATGELTLDELAQRVILPYAVIASVLAGLAFMVRYSPLPDIDSEEKSPTDTQATEGPKSIFKFPNLTLGVLALFLYVGVEVISGDAVGAYGRAQGLPLSETKNFTTYTLIAMVIGYLLGVLTIPKIISQSRALLLSAFLGVTLSLIATFTGGYVSIVSIFLLGTANAVMWPAIWPLAIAGLGRFTKTGSAMLIMAIAGGALLPLLYGLMLDTPSIGINNANWIMVPCYLFIAWYAWKAPFLQPGQS